LVGGVIGEIAHRRLISQRLVGPPLQTPVAAVEWLGAVQAQDYLGAKWALGLRIRRSSDQRVENAFAKGNVLRTHLLRPTWHFVSSTDIRWLLALTAPRVHAVNARMYRTLGLDGATVRRADTVLTRALADGRHRTRDELRGDLERAGIRTDGALRLSYLMMRAELNGLVCSGPRRAKQFTYALLDERVPPAKAAGRAEALVELASRYFTSRGPATVQDFARWSGLTVNDGRLGLEGAVRRLAGETIAGKTYWFAPAKAAPDRGVSEAVHLLSIYDEYVSGYKDRSAMISSQNGARLSAMGNALTHIIVIGGQIVGTWTRVLSAQALLVQADIFRRLSRAEDQAIESAVTAFGDFLGVPARFEKRG
jgi:hypothetical protein